MRLVVTRPVQDAGPLAERLRAMGHEAVVEPMLTVRIDPAAAIPDERWRALVVTSANAVRALKGRKELERLRAVPVFAVGASSAEAARSEGFTDVTSADGDLVALAERIRQAVPREDGRLLYVTGRQISGDLAGKLRKDGYWVERVVLYEAERAQTLSSELADALSGGEIDGVLLFSARTAGVWTEITGRTVTGDAMDGVTHYCLSPAVAALVREGIPVRVAETPDTEALLRLLDR